MSISLLKQLTCIKACGVIVIFCVFLGCGQNSLLINISSSNNGWIQPNRTLWLYAIDAQIGNIEGKSACEYVRMLEISQIQATSYLLTETSFELTKTDAIFEDLPLKSLLILARVRCPINSNDDTRYVLQGCATANLENGIPVEPIKIELNDEYIAKGQAECLGG